MRGEEDEIIIGDLPKVARVEKQEQPAAAVSFERHTGAGRIGKPGARQFESRGGVANEGREHHRVVVPNLESYEI
jgi:hypothetical protein